MIVSLPLVAIFVGVSVVAFGLLVAFTALRPRPAPPDDGPTLLDKVVAAEPPRNWDEQVDRSFDRMVRWTLLNVNPSQAAAFIVLVGVVTAAVAFLVTEDWMVGGGGLLVGMLFPLAVFYAMQGRWRRAVQDQLPDALFLLSRSLRAGQSLEQALVSICPYLRRPTSEVFGRCGEQIELGLAAPEALQRMADAVGLTDVQALATVVRLHRDVGGDLPNLIDRLAAGVRDRNQFRGYYRAATALGRITAAFLALVPVVLAIIFMLDQPALFMNFFHSTLGIVLICLVFVLDAVGILWLSLLLRRIDY